MMNSESFKKHGVSESGRPIWWRGSLIVNLQKEVCISSCVVAMGWWGGGVARLVKVEMELICEVAR